MDFKEKNADIHRGRSCLWFENAVGTVLDARCGSCLEKTHRRCAFLLGTAGFVTSVLRNTQDTLFPNP